MPLNVPSNPPVIEAMVSVSAPIAVGCRRQPMYRIRSVSGRQKDGRTCRNRTDPVGLLIETLEDPAGRPRQLSKRLWKAPSCMFARRPIISWTTDLHRFW